MLICRNGKTNDMIARNLLTLDILPAQPDDTPALLLDRMEDFLLSELPLVDEHNNYQFMLRENDLTSLYDPNSPIGKQNLNSNYRIACYEYQHHMEILKAFAERKTSCIPVVDNKNRFTGLITAVDFLHYLSTNSALIQPGAVIVLEVNSTDYTLTEIARIAESNECKILALDIHSPKDSKKLEVSIKLHQNKISPLIQTYNRFGYKLLAAYSESDYSQDMQERYDSLMKYLEL